MGEPAVLLHVVSAEAVAQLEVPKWCHSQWLAAGTGLGLGQNGSGIRSLGSSHGPLHKGLSRGYLGFLTNLTVCSWSEHFKNKGRRCTSPEGLALSVRSMGIFFLYSHVMYLFLASWVFVASRMLSLVAVSRGCSSLSCTGFSLWWLLL